MSEVKSGTEKLDTVINHMDELRTRIIRVAIVLAVTFVIGVLSVKYLWPLLTMNLAPEQELWVLTPTSPIFVYLKIGAVFAIAITSPFIVYQVWGFVSPALSKSAKKAAFKYIPLVFILFVTGVCFSYFIIFPTVFDFLMHLGNNLMEVQLTAEAYFTFLFRMTIPFGIIFEMPAIMMFTTQIGIINPYVLAKIRKYAYFILTIIGVCFSPPEIILDIITIVPMIIVFEISVFLSKIVYRKKLKREKDEALEEQRREAAEAAAERETIAKAKAEASAVVEEVDHNQPE